MSTPEGKAVFLSYSREDSASALRIADALRAFGIEVWFDQNELRGGDAWDQKIRTQIKTCALFIPIVSAQTETRTEGYFRREWKLAVDRTYDMAGNRAFIVPIVIDDTQEAHANVPEDFMRYQWTRLPGALPTPAFVEQVKRLIASPRTPPAHAGTAAPIPGPATTAAPSATPASPQKNSSPWLWVTIGATLVIVAASLFVIFGRQPARPGAPAPTAAAPAATAPTKIAATDKSIAVLPFANMSEEKDSAFFTDGVHEDILTNLALVRDLKVVSRTTIVRYRDSKKSVREIGEELGVAYVLEGSVRRFGNKVRVTGQLINARTDEHVWAKAYDRDLTDIFAIQSALAQEIAGALQAAISPEAQKFIERRPTQNLVAYDAFLKGRDTRNKSRSGSPAPLKLAETYFQSAVDQDPTFAAAWGELAVAHALHVFWEIDHTPARLALAEAAIQRAVQLAPDSPDVIALVGTHAYYAHRDYAKATAQYEKLARLKPNDPTVFGSLGLIQRRQGRWAESLANLRRAAELDSGNAGYCRNLIQSLQPARRWPELLAEQRRLITLVDDKISEEAALTRFHYLATGSTKEGEAWLAGLTPEQFNSPNVVAIRKRWADLIGNFTEAIRLDRLQPYYDGDGDEHYFQALIMAQVYAAVGDNAGARQRLGDFPTELRARIAREPNNSRIHGALAQMEAFLGNKTEALRLAHKTVELLPESADALDGVNFSLVSLLSVQAWVGEKDAAFESLAHLLKVPSNFGLVHALRTGSRFAPLRGDPRFEKLLSDPKNNAPLF